MRRKAFLKHGNKRAIKLSIKWATSNRIAIFTWIFCLIWVSMLMAFTWLMFRDWGSPERKAYEAWFIVVAWIFAFGFISYALSRSIVRVKIDGKNMFIEEIRPYRITRYESSTDKIVVSEVITEEDSEGEPYFCLYIQLTETLRFRVAEGHDAEAVKKKRKEVLSALLRE